MKILVQKRLIVLLIVTIILLASCSSDKKTTPEPSKTLPYLSIAYCNIDSDNLCLEGFGQEGEDNMLILFKANNPDFANIYVRANENKEDIEFNCSVSEEFSENIYCVGEKFPNGEEIDLKIYTKNDQELIATGKFKIQYGNIQMPDNMNLSKDSDNYEAGSSSPDSPNYPNHPNYPNYPNYPNSTP